jgi:hypothetical protein
MDSPSLPTFVYLTTNFGLAVEHACRISERTARKADIAVAQVDMSTLKKRLLYPDEDYLSHEWNSDFAGWTLDEQLEFMEGKRWTWKESLEMLGTVAYKGVVLASHITECPVLRWFEQEYRRRFQAVTCG